MTTKLRALFFTDKGHGPDEVSLWTRPVDEMRDGADLVCERTLGLMVGARVEHVGDETHVCPLVFSRAGGYQMDEVTVRALRDEFTAWLDAPRLAARATAEVVASDPTNDIELVKTTAGEWGVLAIEAAFDDDGKATGNERRAIEWFSGDGCESSARVLYAEERGKSLCESCLKETGLDGLIEVGESGPMVCESCADAAFDAFQTTRYRCDACKWSGTGADVSVEDDAALCPKCSDFVEVTPPWR